MSNQSEVDALTRVMNAIAERIYLGRCSGNAAEQDVVEIACLLFDWGDRSPAVVEVVERDPQGVAPEAMDALADEILGLIDFDPGFDLAPERIVRLSLAIDTTIRDYPVAWTTGRAVVHIKGEASPPYALVRFSDGWMHGDGLSPGDGDDPVRALAAVAEHVQESLMAKFWRVSPVCRVHGIGLHPTIQSGAAVWWCSMAGGHGMAPVGKLLDSEPQEAVAPGRSRRSSS